MATTRARRLAGILALLLLVQITAVRTYGPIDNGAPAISALGNQDGTG
jgi:hypothetical protein